jgi:chromosomal replication initiation ATPase DnaA
MSNIAIDYYPGLRNLLDETQLKIQDIIGKAVTVSYRINAFNKSLDELLSIVCRVCEVTLPEMTCRDRYHRIIIARHAYCWFGRCWLGHNLVDIAAKIKKDHTTVIHATNKVNDLIAIKDAEYMDVLERIKVEIEK